MAKIIWLASYPKSGNTWLRIFLTNYWRNAQSACDINQLERTPIASSRTLFEELCGFESADLRMDEIDAIRPAVYRHWAASNGETCFAKVHDAYHRLPNGEALFPSDCTAGAIYLIRNPLDVALSFAAHNGQAVEKSIEQMANEAFSMSKSRHTLNEQLRQRLGSWRGHVRSWVDAPESFPRLVVRYEDLYADPVRHFGQIVGFIEGKEMDCVDQERVQRAVAFSSFAGLQAQEDQHNFGERSSFATRFFRKGQPGEWQEQLTPAQIQRVVETQGDVMRRFGYSI